MIGSLRNGWDRFVLYLPLIMVSSLAFGTYWLVHTTPSVGQAPAQALLTHDPDYFMRDFSIRTFDGDGRVRVAAVRGVEVVGADIRDPGHHQRGSVVLHHHVFVHQHADVEAL